MTPARLPSSLLPVFPYQGSHGWLIENNIKLGSSSSSIDQEMRHHGSGRLLQMVCKGSRSFLHQEAAAYYKSGQHISERSVTADWQEVPARKIIFHYLARNSGDQERTILFFPRPYLSSVRSSGGSVTNFVIFRHVAAFHSARPALPLVSMRK